MSTDRLKLVSADNNSSDDVRTFRPKTNREQVQAHFEKLWHRNPEKFDPLKDCMGKERIKRTLHLIEHYCPINQMKVVDLGSGKGVLSQKLKERGAQVTAVDIARNAPDTVAIVHDCIPHTKLDDSSYDLVISTDLIGYLRTREHRLYVSELTRLVKSNGFVICSTPIDIHSEDALDRFISLLETELEVIKWKVSHHAYFIKCLDFIKAPERFSRARKDPHYRNNALANRFGLKKLWFWMNSAPLVGEMWHLLINISQPIHHWLKQSDHVMKGLEKTCRLISAESGISHVIILAKRRDLFDKNTDSHSASHAF